MGKTRDLFKKIRDTKGTFHAKMVSIKDRNGTDLTEQKILRRGGKNTQNYTKKDLHDPDNHDGDYINNNINNLRYADDTTLMAESEELKTLLMKVKRRVKKLA